MKTESIIQRLQEIEELRKQGNRFDLQNIEEDWTDLVDAQIDLERNTTTEIKELQVREIK